MGKSVICSILFILVIICISQVAIAKKVADPDYKYSLEYDEYGEPRDQDTTDGYSPTEHIWLVIFLIVAAIGICSKQPIGVVIGIVAALIAFLIGGF